MEEELMNLDLYELIGTLPTASVKEIKTAYRKKALSCHPDKNPGNPKAAELFRQLSRVLELLIDESARIAYDKVLNARKQAKLRVKQLDSKRRKFKEDLEAREEAYKHSQKNTAYTDEQHLKAEIERLRKEGSRQVEEEIASVKRQIYENLHNDQKGNNEIGGRVKIKWKCDKNDEDNGGYNYEILHNILAKYGDITILVVSNMKKGSALVEYKEKSAAIMATQIEVGLAKNPLILRGLWESSSNNEHTNLTKNTFFNNTKTTSVIFPSINRSWNKNSNTFSSFSSAPDIFQTTIQKSGYISDVNFENSVLSNMRRAEERKRLLDQMKAEDEGT